MRHRTPSPAINEHHTDIKCHGQKGWGPPKYLTTDATYGSPTFLILYENDEKDWEKMCRNVENNTWQAETMDWKPEPQARLTFRDGEEKGTPRRIETCLRMYPAYSKA